LATLLGVEQTSGIVVQDVVTGSPADTAGLWPGDIIIGVNGKETHSPRI
jgi:S1-C subfamily serine protease